jgi:hypothetical protein
MAKKPTKYPRKFRQKLEKIAEARDERALKDPHDMTEEEIYEAASATFWKDFLPEGSVAMMHAKINENQRRIEMTYHLEIPHRRRVIGFPAPWRLDEETGSPRST